MEGLKGRVGFVAIGAYGGNQGELFYKAKYPVVFINTAQQDLDSLTDIPDSDKYHIPGGEGCSKDRNKSKTIFSEDLDNVVNVIKKKLVGLDYIFIIGSCGGGTGSGILASMKRIIVSELEPKACMVITVLPNTRTESLKALENAYNTLCEIEQLEEPGATFILDNDRLGDKLKINELFFTYLDALLTNNSTSKYGNADTEEIQVMLQTPGMAVITLLDKDKTNTQQIIKSSMVLSKVGDMSSEDATKYLTASLNGYKLQADAAESVVSKISSVDLVSATNSSGLAEAMSRVAVTADQAGISMDRLLGMAEQI